MQKENKTALTIYLPNQHQYSVYATLLYTRFGRLP